MSESDPRDPYAPPPESQSRSGGPAGTPGAPPGRAGGTSGRGGPALPDGRRALLLAIGGVALLVPLLPAGIVLAAAGLMLGLRARRQAARVDGTAPGAVGAVIVGGIGVFCGLFGLAVAGYLFTELRDYRECLSRANTEIGRQECWSEFERSYRRRLGA